MKQLFDIGFQPVGCWRLNGESLGLELTDKIDHTNVLYAFISGDELLYVGKTTRTLRRRMSSYLRPSASQRTNLRNNLAIRAMLVAGRNVDILAFADVGLLRYGDFKINFAAALEDSIIATLAPPWNGAPSRLSNDDDEPSYENEAPGFTTPSDDPAAEIDVAFSTSSPSFEFVLQKTYFDQGFFNVGVAYQHLFPVAGSSLDIYCGQEKHLVHGRFDRSSNNNGTPRVFGYSPLRDWFRKYCTVMQSINVRVIGPSSLELLGYYESPQD